MKTTLRYVALGLEVWLGVLAMLAGTYSLISTVGIGFDPALPEIEKFAGVALAVLGAILVADAVRRELRVHLYKKMESFGNPLDSPTQAG